MLKRDLEKELFDYEIKVIEEARKYIYENRDNKSDLIQHYISLSDNYDKLLKITRKLLRISDKQGRVLIKRENEIKNILDNSNQGFFTLNNKLIVNKEYSSECARIFGRKIYGLHISSLFANTSIKDIDKFIKEIDQALICKDEKQREKIIDEFPKIININNKFLSIQYRIFKEYEDSNDKIIMIILTDITEKEEANKQITYLSYHDKLTSLYNRAYIDSVFPILQTAQNMPFSMIVLDMNGLKLINDVFGHETGDKMICEMAKLLSNCCKSNDIIARWGGDEFIILLPKTDYNSSTKVCAKIKDKCKKTDVKQIRLSAAIGCATQETLNMNASELFCMAESRMYNNKTSSIKETSFNMLEDIEKILYTKCLIDKEHFIRIKKNSKKLAEKLEIDSESEQMKKIELLAYMHDIGKVGLPAEIFSKQSQLNEDDWSSIKKYPEIGYRLVQAMGDSILARAVYSMREHWDGRGYPRGIKGDEIPLTSRIISIVEAYDVMLHGSTYKEPLKKDRALEEIKKHSGTQFDPEIAKCFIDLMIR